METCMRQAFTSFLGEPAMQRPALCCPSCHADRCLDLYLAICLKSALWQLCLHSVQRLSSVVRRTETLKVATAACDLSLRCEAKSGTMCLSVASDECRAYPNVQNLFRELNIQDRLQVIPLPD